MQPISSFLPPLPSASDLQLPARFRTSDVLRVKTSTETHADLTVLTAGGDRVTLSTESLLRASYTDLRFQSTDASQSIDLHATTSDVKFHNSFDLSVQGDLDQHEEADLQRLVGKLQKIVKEFLGGDLDGAVSKALQLGDLGTVAGFQLNVLESERITVTQKQSISSHGPHALQPHNVDMHGQNSPSLLTQLVDSINDAKIDLNKLLKRLPQVLRQLLQEIEPKVSDANVAQLFFAVETLLRPASQPSDPTSPKIDTL